MEAVTLTMYVGSVLRLPGSGLLVKGPSRTPLLSIWRSKRAYMLRFLRPIRPEPHVAGSHSFFIHWAQRWRSEKTRRERITNHDVITFFFCNSVYTSLLYLIISNYSTLALSHCLPFVLSLVFPFNPQLVAAGGIVLLKGRFSFPLPSACSQGTADCWGFFFIL